MSWSCKLVQTKQNASSKGKVDWGPGSDRKDNCDERRHLVRILKWLIPIEMYGICDKNSVLGSPQPPANGTSRPLFWRSKKWTIIENTRKIYQHRKSENPAEAKPGSQPRCWNLQWNLCIDASMCAANSSDRTYLRDDRLLYFHCCMYSLSFWAFVPIITYFWAFILTRLWPPSGRQSLVGSSG